MRQYLNLGANIHVRKKDIIGIFDLDTASHEEETKKFLRSAEKRKCTRTCGSGLPKSFIIAAPAVDGRANRSGQTDQADRADQAGFANRTVRGGLSAPCAAAVYFSSLSSAALAGRHIREEKEQKPEIQKQKQKEKKKPL